MQTSDPGRGSPQKSSTACRRCRGHKVKCSRELPDCTRCASNQVECHYPSPPDRKAIAKTRAPWGARYRRNMERPARSDFQDELTQLKEPHLPLVAQGCDSAHLLSQPLGLYLIEILFSHYICASAVFRKDQVIKEYLDGILPEYVSRAIFALASVFVDNPQEMARLGQTSMPLSMLRVQAQTWASLSSQYCLLHAHQPSLSVIQANEMVSTFWFARGEIHRAKLHAHVAFVAARGLGYHNFGRFGANDGGDYCSPDQKLGYRCFWNCWVILFVILKDDAFTMSADSSLQSLPQFRLSCPKQPTLSDLSNEDEEIFLGAVELLHIYHDIQIFKTKVPEPIQEHIDHIVKLKQRMIQFYDESAYLRYTGSYRGYSQSYASKVFFIHSLYNIAMISLHSYFISFFTGTSIERSLPADFIQSCTNTTVHHTETFVDMIHSFLHIDGKVSELPPFAGYCSFLVASIYISCLPIQNAIISVYARERLLSCLIILGELRKYWTPLERLWQKIFELLGDQISAQDVIDRRYALQHHDVDQSWGSEFLLSLGISEYMHHVDTIRGLYRVPYVLQGGMESPASSPEQVPERFVQDQIPDWNESRLNSNEETLDQANLSSLRDLNFIGDDLPAFVAGQGDLTSLMDDSTAFL